MVSARDCLELRPLVQVASERGYRAAFGKGASGLDVDAVVRAGRAILTEQPLPAAALGKRLQVQWPQYAPDVLANLVRTHVPLVQVPPRGLWGKSGASAHVPADVWLGAPLAKHPSLDEMILRYVAAFGPATVQDAQTWSGLTKLGEAFHRLAPRLIMARPLWSGSISFGLVNVPVKAFTAVRDHDVHFHQVDKKSGARIRHRNVSESSGREVKDSDIEMGFELSKGHYVTFEKDELRALRPASTKAIEVDEFVALEEIDPIYYERTYWLAPDGEAGAKAYQLLLAAMEDRERVAIGSVVMRNKQYLTAIRPLEGALAMSTMAPASRRSVMKLLNRPTMMANFNPAAER